MLLQRLRAFLSPILKLLPGSDGDRKRRERTAQAKAGNIAELLRRNDFAELREHFFLPFRWLVPAAVLKKGYDLICLSAGALEDVGSPRTSAGWLLTSVYIPVRFKRVKLALALTLTPGDSLVGLRFMPLALAGFGSKWQPPPYGDTVKVEEQEIQLGKPKVQVKGTLTLPAEYGKHPCVVMLAGSGPVDRDSTVGACKPFKDISLGLAARGIATLRFDKVTLTHGRKVRGSRSFTIKEEYLDHAKDAVRHCLSDDRISSQAVFVLGHSLGGYVAPHFASIEPAIAGCILMATPAIPMYRSALQQLRGFAAMDGESSGATENEQIKELEQQCEVVESKELSLSTPSSKLPFGIGAAYWLDHRKLSPLETAAELNKPMLILQGGRDYQVTAQNDFAAWRTLGSTPGVDFKLFESLNHLFISGESQSVPLEYEDPGNVDETVVDEIARWIINAAESE